MKYFLDTEFIENGRTIDLISIAIVAEDGREYYAVSNEFDPSKASEWVVENVLTHLPALGEQITLRGCGDESVDDFAWKSRAQIKADILDFIGLDKAPEFWAYFADYDWIVLCQLFGTMMDLPEHFPKYCRDIKQLADDLGFYPIPIPDAEPKHSALADAVWALNAWEFLTLKGNCNALRFVNSLRPEVGNFAMAMEMILQANDHKGGWYACPLSNLRNGLEGEVWELKTALQRMDLENAQKETVDIANYAMMIFSNIENIKAEKFKKENPTGLAQV